MASFTYLSLLSLNTVPQRAFGTRFPATLTPACSDRAQKESDRFVVIFLQVHKGQRDGSVRILLPGTLLLISYRHRSTWNLKARNSLDLFIWLRTILPDVLQKNPIPITYPQTDMFHYFVDSWGNTENEFPKFLGTCSSADRAAPLLEGSHSHLL